MPTTRRVREHPCLPAGALLFLAASLAVSCGRPDTPAGSASPSSNESSLTPAQLASRSPWLPRPPGPEGYVSAEACVECHAEEHSTWHASFHRSMTQVMTTNSVRADFDGVQLEFGGERFQLGRDGNRFWVDVVDLDTPEGARGAARFPMEMVTGSHQMQVFWLPAGAGNAQVGFPFTWLINEARWVPRDATFIRDPHAPQQVETWNMTCIRCHVTAGMPRPRKDEGIFDTRLADFGISCEACHGPAEQHVAFQRAAKAAAASAPASQPGSAPAPSPAPRADPAASRPSPTPGVQGAPRGPDPIVQPRKLDHVRASHVCGQCHSIKWFGEGEDWVERGFRYRPGDNLEETTPVVRPGRIEEQPWMRQVLARAPGLLEEFFWSDGMIRVAGREFNGLLESACFQRGEMSCLSCHAMHAYSEPSDQLRRGMDGDRACTQCHAEERYGEAHTHHPPNSPGSLCYNCHMPHTTYALLRGIRQHQIDSPRAEASLRTGRPNACNLCHLDRSLAWTASHLAAWYNHPAFDGSPPGPDHADGETSAIVKALLQGDAGRRALAAWHLGWEPAVQLTGDDWQAPLLARLLNDPYAAVRYIAHASLRKLPGFEAFPYDYVAPPDTLNRSAADALARWRGARHPRSPESARALLLRDDGASDPERIESLQRNRDDRPMRLRE